ncbi:Sec-independent protein translocase protein TatB [Rhizobium lemnae]|uniref:Sec-independent protein translocase protein TatB n=1 Tax=Rhizobium lemnae TaxID=1214924 RepID=A0ABV8EA21_9HYPH
MLDIGWTELLVIAVVLIVVVGPKDLPPMLRAFGKMTSNLRKMAGDFRTQFDEALREADMDGVRQTIDDAKRFHPANAIREAINPLREMGNEIRNDLQKATEFPGTTTADAAVEGSTTTSVDDLIPAPAFSLPETPPLTPSAAPVASAQAPPTVVTSQPSSVGAAAAASTPSAMSSSGTANPPVVSATGLTKAPVETSSTSSVPAPDAAKTPRSRKPATPKLVAPAVPAVVSGAGADKVAVKRTRTRKPAADVAEVSSATPGTTRRSASKKTETVDFAKTTSAEVTSDVQTAAPRARKKKTPAPKDQE